MVPNGYTSKHPAPYWPVKKLFWRSWRTYSRNNWTMRCGCSCRRVRSSLCRGRAGATPPHCRYIETPPSSLPLTTIHRHPTENRCWVASTRQVEPPTAHNRTLQHTALQMSIKPIPNFVDKQVTLQRAVTTTVGKIKKIEFAFPLDPLIAL